MTRQAVQSSSIKSLGYDAETHELHVEFANGGVYAYAGVPAQVFEDLWAAPSIGKHFQQHVRGAFAHTKVGSHEKSPRGTARA